ncbi:MAG TPA: hypothetical protein VKS79_16540 [Gemmataceae bacterium]|nr:hypothetical protein [Gemmataceae bacterium]
MSHELYYTSVPNGLQPSDHGFCVVAQTRGLPSDLLAKLKIISDYRELIPPGDPQAARNPVRYSHLRIKLGSRRYHVLTRACFAGRDYSQRTNKFVHHVVFDASELASGGPAWALLQPGFMETGFDGKPRYIERGRSLPDDEPSAAPCRAWEMETGDAGWAGVLAAATTPDRPAFLIYNLGQEPLTLIGEALALLPPERRWDVTFSTYFCGLPPDVWCQWRCVIDGSDEARVAEGTPGALILPLSSAQGTAPPTDLVQAARTGRRVSAPVPVKAVAVPAEDYTPSPVTSARAAAVRNSPPRPRTPEPVNLADGNWKGPSKPELVMEHPKSRTGASLLWLVAGLFLGIVLVVASVLLIELATGHGLLGPSPTEKAALAENQQLKDAAQTAERSSQASLRAKEERIRSLESDLENAHRKASPASKDPPPQKKDDFWGLIYQMGRGIDQKKAKELRHQLVQAQKENEELKKRIKELEAKLAKGNDAPPPMEDPKRTKPKDPNPKTDTPKNDTPSSLEEDNAKSQLDKARKLVDSDKDAAIKVLNKIIEEHPKTRAAEEAKKLLKDLK